MVIARENSITHNGQTKNIGFRDNLRFQGFHIGMHSDMAINPDDLDDTSTYQYYDHAWDFIVELKDKDKAKWGAFSSLEKATRILKGYDKANTSSVLLYPLDQLDPVEFLNPDSYTGVFSGPKILKRIQRLTLAIYLITPRSRNSLPELLLCFGLAVNF